ncbi:MAG: hypothetical protein SGJ09_08080 [Phycisphaerae bacterium]|nr:hypothetical protein [Phycisphaerae bacterium]
MADNEQAAPAADSSPMSLEDRVANLFEESAPQPKEKADPETAEELDPTGEAADPDVPASEDDAPDGADPTGDGLVEAEYGGELFLVTPRLKEALIHASDYTKKTQEIAEQRRANAFEHKKLQAATAERKFADSVKTELETLAQIDQRLGQFKNVDVSSLEARDIALMQYQVNQLKEQKQDTERTLDGRYRDFQGSQQKAMDELMHDGREMIRKNIPNFNESVAREIAAQFKTEGYSDEEVSSSLDPRIFRLAYKAAQFDKLKSQRTQTTQTLQKAKPLGKAASPRPMDSAARDRIAFSKAKGAAKTSAEKARVIEAYLAKQF